MISAALAWTMIICLGALVGFLVVQVIDLQDALADEMAAHRYTRDTLRFIEAELRALTRRIT